MRGPSTASRAGSRVRAAVIATSTAATPPYPIDRRNACGKMSSEASEAATISPENSTVRPAVAIVRADRPGRVGASLPGWPRELLAEPAHHEQRVVDRQPHAEQGDDVDREDRDVGDPGQQPHHGERAEDRDRADQGGHQGRDQAAEDQQAEQEHDRHAQRLGAGDVLRDLVVDVAEDGPLAADLGAQAGGVERRRRRVPAVATWRPGCRRRGVSTTRVVRPSVPTRPGPGSRTS